MIVVWFKGSIVGKLSNDCKLVVGIPALEECFEVWARQGGIVRVSKGINTAEESAEAYEVVPIAYEAVREELGLYGFTLEKEGET